ncbi:transposable element Tcb1 transposase [Trichonephila clavipes]|nr:transposable element Tcb1 transposase [Trichonephila clavipes]
MHCHTGPAPGIIVLSGIGFHCYTPTVRIAGTLNSQVPISEVLEYVVLPYIQPLPSVVFQQDNVRYAMFKSSLPTRLNCFLGCLFSRSRSMLAQHRDTPDQLCNMWKPHGLLYPEGYIQGLFDSMPRRGAEIIANNGGYTNC